MTSNDPDKQDSNESFKDLMGDVKPLHHDKHKPHRNKLQRHQVKRQPDDSHFEPEVELPFVSNMHDHSHNQLGGADKIAYNASGIGHKVAKQLSQGKVRVQASCDLHGMSLTEAEQYLARFLDACIKDRLKCVRVVHGKSGVYAKIKSWCAQVLPRHDKVLAVHSCSPRDGGTGAVYVLLKTR